MSRIVATLANALRLMGAKRKLAKSLKTAFSNSITRRTICHVIHTPRQAAGRRSNPESVPQRGEPPQNRSRGPFATLAIIVATDLRTIRRKQFKTIGSPPPMWCRHAACRARVVSRVSGAPARAPIVVGFRPSYWARRPRPIWRRNAVSEPSTRAKRKLASLKSASCRSFATVSQNINPVYVARSLMVWA